MSTPGGVDAADEHGWTPLHWASAQRKPEHVAALLDSGGNAHLQVRVVSPVARANTPPVHRAGGNTARLPDGRRGRRGAPGRRRAAGGHHRDAAVALPGEKGVRLSLAHPLFHTKFD
jgi:ankyrin repeat protein